MSQSSGFFNVNQPLSIPNVDAYHTTCRRGKFVLKIYLLDYQEVLFKFSKEKKLIRTKKVLEVYYC